MSLETLLFLFQLSSFMMSSCLVQMENGCILSSTYSGGRALPNRNGAAPPAVQMPGPETLSGLPDPPATGFYL